MLPPTAVMMSATTGTTTTFEQSNIQPPLQSNTNQYSFTQGYMVQYELPPPAYQEQHKTLPMPHPPLQGFLEHGYPLDSKQGYPLGQEPPLDHEEALAGYPPAEHSYEYMSPGSHVLPSKY